MRNNHKKITKFFSRGFILLILSIICAVIFIHFISNRVKVILLPVSNSIVRKFVASTINNSTKEIKFDKELFSINKDETGEIKTITYNTYEVTKIINEITSNIQLKFNKLENDKNNNYIVQEVPLGIIFGNILLRNIGPMIKVKFNIDGNVLTNIETEVKPYGINNAYLETRVYLEARAMVILPFVSNEVIVTNVIPISMNVVQGVVPKSYISSYK